MKSNEVGQMESDVDRELDDSTACAHGLDPVIHEVSHDEQMDDLGKHEPITHVFRQQTASLVSVQLRIREDPEHDEQYS